MIAQRFYNFFPNYVLALCLVNVAYRPPSSPLQSQSFNLDNVIKYSEEKLCYGCFHYWKLQIDPNGPSIYNHHLESAFDAIYANPESWRYKTFCQPDGLKNFLLHDLHYSYHDRDVFATEDMKREFLDRMSRDGFDAPLAYYRAIVHHVHSHGNVELYHRGNSLVVNVPTLFVGYTQDYACPPVGIKQPSDQGFLPHLSTAIFTGGHWGLLAKPEEFGRAVVNWLDGVFR